MKKVRTVVNGIVQNIEGIFQYYSDKPRGNAIPANAKVDVFSTGNRHQAADTGHSRFDAYPEPPPAPRWGNYAKDPFILRQTRDMVSDARFDEYPEPPPSYRWRHVVNDPLIF